MENIILGVCIMSCFSMLAVLMADSGHEKMAIVFCGPAAWAWMGVLKLIDVIKNIIKRKKFKSLVLCPDNIIRYIDSNKVDILFACKDREYKFASFECLGVQATRWPKEYRTTLGKQTVGSMRYCPKSVWKRYEEISKDDYKNARAN